MADEEVMMRGRMGGNGSVVLSTEDVPKTRAHVLTPPYSSLNECNVRACQYPRTVPICFFLRLELMGAIG